MGMISLLVALTLVDQQGPVTVDWTQGVVVAEAGVGPSLRDPSPQVARVAAERAARKIAATRLWAAVEKLPVAGGGTVGKKLSDEAREKLEKLAEDAPIVRARHASDGGIEIQIRFPLLMVAVALNDQRSASAHGRIVIVKGGSPVVVPGADVRFFPSVGDAKKEKTWLGADPPTIKRPNLSEPDLRGGPVAVVIEK
jgi:hypothetical protein